MAFCGGKVLPGIGGWFGVGAQASSPLSKAVFIDAPWQIYIAPLYHHRELMPPRAPPQLRAKCRRVRLSVTKRPAVYHRVDRIVTRRRAPGLAFCLLMGKVLSSTDYFPATWQTNKPEAFLANRQQRSRSPVMFFFFSRKKVSAPRRCMSGAQQNSPRFFLSPKCSKQVPPLVLRLCRASPRTGLRCFIQARPKFIIILLYPQIGFNFLRIVPPPRSLFSQHLEPSLSPSVFFLDVL